MEVLTLSLLQKPPAALSNSEKLVDSVKKKKTWCQKLIIWKTPIWLADLLSSEVLEIQSMFWTTRLANDLAFLSSMKVVNFSK